MPRDLPIGNGSLLISFDQNYQIRDIYYPYVGEVSHTLGHPSRFGVWVEGQFSWINSPVWNKCLHYQDETLVTDVTITNPRLGIKLKINDAVEYIENVYLRKITTENLSCQDREIRLFITHDLHLLESRGCDTVYYDPRTKSIIHYKRSQYFLINCFHSDSSGIDKYAVGIQEFNGAEGTWRDAEDGILSGDPVADGSVDSTIAIHLRIPAGSEKISYYWMAAGRSYEEVASLNSLLIDKTPEYFIKRTADYWKSWLKIDANGILPESIIDLYKRSFLILRTQIDNNGAILAANDFDPVDSGMDGYSYMWPRDGAMVAYSLDKAGYREITERFFQFCADVITPEGYFLHKYNPDRSKGSSWHPWVMNNQMQLPIQEDGTALVIWALWHHFSRYKIEFVKPLYETLIIRAGNFMLDYIDEATGLPRPSYDLWEERYGVHIFTTAAVCAALNAEAGFADVFGNYEKANEFRIASKRMKKAMDEHLYSKEHGRFLRTIYPSANGYIHDLTYDSSVYATFAFGIYDAQDDRVASTMRVVYDNLAVKSEIDGIARYWGDHLHRVSSDLDNVPGNPWIICSLWKAQYLIAKAKTISEIQDAVPILQWVADHALESGVLPEQLHPYTGQPLSVSPLSWSHGEFILTVSNFIEKARSMS